MKQKVLVLGGTQFVGRQLVEKLLKDDRFEVYLFNRGRTNPNLFPNAQLIKGDRETADIQQIADYEWDYIIDFTAYFPDSLKNTLQYVNRSVKRYIFISTIAVYPFSNSNDAVPFNEEIPRRCVEPHHLEDKTLKYYGENKVACEDVLTDAQWLPFVIIRPSIIYGDFDPTQRLYYWINKIYHQESLLLPYQGAQKITLTYAQDLVTTLMAGIDEKLPLGAYNVASNNTVVFKEMLELIKTQLNTSCDFIDLQADQFEKFNLKSSDFPMCMQRHFMVNSEHLHEKCEIEFESFEESIKKTIQHYQEMNWPKLEIGLPSKKEQELLAQL